MHGRALGLWETFKAITHDACLGFETMSISTQIQGPIDISLFTKALEFVYDRHPLLQAIIQEKEDVYYYQFNTFKDIPIQFQKGVSEEIFQHSFLDAANASLEPGKYLWKVNVFYTNNRAIFTIIMHHSPCDGRSMTNIVDDILYAYTCYLDNKTPNRPNLPLLPATEHLAIKNISLERYLKQRAELVAITTQKDSIISLGPQSNFVPFAQRETYITYNELSEEQTTKIQDFCNENQLKSNSLLNGLMLITAQRVQGSPLSLAMLTPVQTKASIDEDQVGCHVCLVTTLYENINSATDLLKLSHEYQEKLKEGIHEQANLPREFTKMDVCNAYGLNLNLDFYKYQLVVSNLGDVPVEKRYKECTVEKIHMGVNNRAGAVACVLITYILHNKMHLAFVYNRPLVSEDYMNSFSKAFMLMIQGLC